MGRLCPVLPGARALTWAICQDPQPVVVGGSTGVWRDFAGEGKASHSSLPSCLCDAGVKPAWISISHSFMWSKCLVEV